MQQRQLRLGDILDDYCPRERRVTNHAIVAMVGEDVKQTRCTTCDTEHEYKHAKIPRQRKKSESPAALIAQVASAAPKRVTHEPPSESPLEPVDAGEALMEAQGEGATGEDARAEDARAEDGQLQAAAPQPDESLAPVVATAENAEPEPDERDDDRPDEDGPVHRPLIRASLPRPEGQQPPQRPLPEFTIRQPGGRPNRFRPRHQRGGGNQGHQFQGNRSNGNMGGPMRGPRPNSGRPGMMKRHGPPGRKRSK